MMGTHHRVSAGSRVTPALAQSARVATPIPLPWDEHRGIQSMAWFILTEAMLFVSLFFSYFLLRDQNAQWPMDEPPKLGFALAMLVVLLASSAVVEWGRKKAKAGDEATGRLALSITVLLGIVFLVLQGFEYHEHLKTMLPTDDAYASMFYTITSIHGFHVILGLLMLAYVAMLPHIGPGSDKPPHRPLHTASLYWHFVDAAWVVIVVVLYIAPHAGSGA
jgi:heme/copper-type cytochrome/quinol oxidase subunit 3